VTIAIIPARGGSKRIPGKNIRLFHGQPMIAWPIQAALASGLFDQVVVSTEDEEIAATARAAGATTPFLRPASLADDFTGVLPVITHALDAITAATGREPDLVCALYATAPFVQTTDLIRGHEALTHAPEQDYAISVAEFPFPIQRALRQIQTAHGPGLTPFFPDKIETRSQDLEPAYHDAAHFIWCRPKALRAGASDFSPRSIPIPIASKYVQDIDTPDDWARAEAMFAALAMDDAARARR